MLPSEYITGLIEGEGSFTYSYNRTTNSIGLYFAIALSAKDMTLLEQVQEYFGGAGRLYQVKPDLGKFNNPKYISGAKAYYRITRIGELFKVLAHFDKYSLHGQKAKAYEIWKKMVLFKAGMYRHEMPQMLALAAELSKLNGPTEKKILKPENAHLLPKRPVPDFQYDHNSRYYDPMARY